MEIQHLHDNRWVSLRRIVAPEHNINGHVYSHETRCQGHIVAILPYRETPDGREYLLRREFTPCWDIHGLSQGHITPTLSALTGGWEGDDPLDDVIRELHEEAGYVLPSPYDDVRSLGSCRASKSSDTLYWLYTVDLTDVPRGEAIPYDPDDLVNINATCEWVTETDVRDCQDAQVAVMFLRLPQ
jgi:8-oxo-dGTP pyrophosphatase MutT (NUDIX family)